MDLEDVFRSHQKEIYVYLYRVLGDPHVAEDLAQETFARACSSALRFGGRSSIRTWLFAIARNVVADHFRRRPNESAGTPVPEVSVGGDEARVDAEHVLASLPLLSREAIVLCDVLGLSPGEAATAIGVSSNAFRVRLHRARGQFRRAYDGE